jgi:hypothetical protein
LIIGSAHTRAYNAFRLILTVSMSAPPSATQVAPLIISPSTKTGHLRNSSDTAGDTSLRKIPLADMSYMSYVKAVFVTHRWLNTMHDKKPLLPIPVRRALLQLGEDIRNARRRRRIQTQLMAERASINRMTLYRIEHGDPRVAMGSYATVLFVLGMLDRLSQVAAATQDQVGLDLEDEILPKRIRNPRLPRSPSTPQS